ncbi:MAG: ComF family protein [Fimbriimonadaceae bacterium]|nr:ComF family protein [Fimbriimonadaceae bacterium]
MSEADSWWNSSGKWVADFLYPSQCALCGTLGTPAMCATCQLAFPIDDSGLQKLGGDDPLDARIALYRYRDRARQAVQRLKYDRVTALAKPMSELIADAYSRFGFDDFECVVPVPIHWTRRFERGFNQSELLCRAIESPIASHKLLRRVRATAAQVNLTPAQRRENIRNAFVAHGEFEGKAVLLVDDVFTTGHTARECARVLKSAGASEVVSLTFCAGA